MDEFDESQAWHLAPADARSVAAAKEAMPASLLMTLANRRVRWIPQVQAALARQAHLPIRVGRPGAHARDADGRNWNITEFECGEVNTAACAEMFRTIIDRLRDEFDLA